MQVILKNDVPNLGDKGEVVDVARGYANNYLIPKNLAILATGGAIRDAENMARSRRRREAGNIAAANEHKSALEAKNLTAKVKAGVDGTLYGSVGKRNIADLIKDQHGFEVNYKLVQTDRPIKTVGEHEVPVRLHRDVTALVTLVVEGDVDPAELEAAKAEQARLEAEAQAEAEAKAEAENQASEEDQVEEETVAEEDSAETENESA